MVSESEYMHKLIQPIPTIAETMHNYIRDEAKRLYPVKESPLAALVGMDAWMKGNYK